jgi:hypothetical protein
MLQQAFWERREETDADKGRRSIDVSKEKVAGLTRKGWQREGAADRGRGIWIYANFGDLTFEVDWRYNKYHSLLTIC